ncbi:LPXTG cell wall anchor domain-containing protein [uncultured Ruminococcus sp.]|uniref:LPXTG cell wall anchor domain-containing protein n=1 Tax=uncultured Ruminococcus sp. TaxID=165186 RepID=UPI002613D8FD|nr:LPXTG cell wall anchor domain-containing protein [uncultured Ruminococcus sp.]
MKTTFKKTMAALSAAAVVAASAAVMAVPASAAGATVTISSVTLTLDELKAANYEVTLPVTVDAAYTKLAYGMKIGDGLTFVSAKAMAGGAAVEEAGSIWVAGASASAVDPADAPTCGKVTVKVTDAAAPGDTFTVEGLSVAPAGNSAEYANVEAGVENSVPTVVSGVITIAADQTETSTEAPTTTTAAETTTTTAAPVATTTKAPAKSTSSPKTGDALPIAGVAAAVAVIGGVAFVAKKRK